jgi:RNA polymerase sigma-70 factor (ECF subfamily)
VLKENLLNEEEIIRLAQQGDQEAFHRLVEQYSGLVERTVRVLVYDRAELEDTVQEVWLDAWRGLRGFEPGKPFRPWLLAILANRCRQRGRKTRLATVALDPATAEEMPDVKPDVPTQVIEHFYYADLKAELNHLPASQLELIALRFFADLELEEIARLLQQPLSTVKSRLYRTLNTLRQTYRNPNPDRP